MRRLVLVACACTLLWGCNSTNTAVENTDVVNIQDLPRIGGGEPIDAIPTLTAIRQYADEHPDAFAGRILAGGHFYVGFTKDAASNLAALRQRLTNPSTVRAFRASRTYGDLVALQARVSADRELLKSEGADVCGSFIDEQHNDVRLVLPRVTAATERLLQQRYGPGAVASRQRCPQPVG